MSETVCLKVCPTMSQSPKQPKTAETKKFTMLFNLRPLYTINVSYVSLYIIYALGW